MAWRCYHKYCYYVVYGACFFCFVLLGSLVLVGKRRVICSLSFLSMVCDVLSIVCLGQLPCSKGQFEVDHTIRFVFLVRPTALKSRQFIVEVS